MEDNQILVLRDNARNELLQIKSVEDGITYLNKLKSIDVWVKAEKKDAELQNIVAEQKLRTQRILGELIADGQRKGTIATPKDNNRSYARPEQDVKRILDIGITHKQSSTFKKIATIPEPEFEKFINQKKQAVNNAVSELTTTGAVRLAKSLDDRKSDLKKMQSLDHRLEIESKLKELAKSINRTYTKQERIYFITLIKQ